MVRTKKALMILAILSIALQALYLLQYKPHNVAVFDRLRESIAKPLGFVMEQLGGEVPIDPKEWKTIVFWSSWFEYDWSYGFGNYTAIGLRNLGCPIWKCNFTYDKSVLSTADAVIIHMMHFGSFMRQVYNRPKYQRWIWYLIEAPDARMARNITEETTPWNPSFLINWTMTYHRNADIVGPYGHFTAIDSTELPLVSNHIYQFPNTMKRYQEDMAAGVTLSDVMGPYWQRNLNKTKIVAWMSSHCYTPSRREEYIKELAKHIEIDTFGKCGKRNCTGRLPFTDKCWTNVLTHYSFYMTMENSICDDYITEKLYLPMISNIVPVVWGGSNYSMYLPPGSYIDARRYHPKDLAIFLTYIHNNPAEYAKYHLWRGYWKVHLGSTFCQLCHRLHTDTKEKHYFDIGNFRNYNGKCINGPHDIFDKDKRPEFWTEFLKKHNSTML